MSMYWCEIQIADVNPQSPPKNRLTPNLQEPPVVYWLDTLHIFLRWACSNRLTPHRCRLFTDCNPHLHQIPSLSGSSNQGICSNGLKSWVDPIFLDLKSTTVLLQKSSSDHRSTGAKVTRCKSPRPTLWNAEVSAATSGGRDVLSQLLPSGYVNSLLLKMAIYSGFSY